MHLLNLFADYGTIAIVSLIVLSFTAGFIDAIVGGGGLIQAPALLIALPNTPLATIFGTNKIASLAGTATAAVHYAKRIKFNYKVLLAISLAAGLASFLGARLVSHLNANALKPVILIILIAIAIYTFFKKDLGAVETKKLSLKKQLLFGSLIGAAVGFYDGFFGPGAGSFLILGFVVVLGFEFIQASAYAKVINCITNLTALFVFIKQGNYLLELALLLAVCNMSGNLLGTKLALKRGNSFVRNVFLFVVSLLIVRYAYDVFRGN